MSGKSMGFGLALLIAIGLALGYSGWQMVRSQAEQSCDVCGRPLHADSGVVGLVGDQTQTFCCAACALTARKQTDQAIRIIELTDYESGQAIDPQDAHVVVGSRLNLCMRQQALLDQVKGVSPMEFDRCSPSTLAFVERTDAEKFVAQYGGTLMSFDELEAAFGQQAVHIE